MRLGVVVEDAAWEGFVVLEGVVSKE
jgi:hypothetical protein